MDERHSWIAGPEDDEAPTDGGLAGAQGKAGDPQHEAEGAPATGSDRDESSLESTSPIDLLRGTRRGPRRD